MHVKSGNDSDTDKQITEENTKVIGTSDKDISVTEPLGDTTLQRFV